MIYRPLNTSDLMMTAGIYGAAPPPLPYTMGRERVGRIIETGPGVSKFSIGDLVMATVAPIWQSEIVRNIKSLILLPEGIDLQQAAMLRSCPAMAALMLQNFVGLKPVGWVIQNVASSVVGTCLAQMASSRSIRTLNIVRRIEAGAHLAKIPVTIVVEHVGGPSDELAEKLPKQPAAHPLILVLMLSLVLQPMQLLNS